MRILFARLLAIVTGLLIVMLAIAFAVIRNAADASRAAAPLIPSTTDARGETPSATAIARGRDIYVTHGCRRCHSFQGEGNTRSPLDGVSGRLTAEEIRRWIVAPQEMDAAVTKRGYRLREEDLDALIAYLTRSDPGRGGPRP